MLNYTLLILIKQSLSRISRELMQPSCVFRCEISSL